MTPQALVALAALLMELRDWLERRNPGCLDAGIVDYAVTICANSRRELVEDGAK